MNEWLAYLRHVWRHPYALLPGAPSGIIYDAQAWVDQQRKAIPRDLRRGPIHCYWKKHAETLQAFPKPIDVLSNAASAPAERILCTAPTALFLLSNCKILSNEGTVISSDNRVFAEFTYEESAGSVERCGVFRRRRFPKPKRLPGTFATLSYPSSGNYYHWVAESLPRLHLLEGYLEALDGIFVPGGKGVPFSQCLAAFGIRESQLVFLNVQSHYQPEKLLVPQYCGGLNIAAWVPAYLQQRIFRGKSQSQTKRIFISRRDAASRQIVNEFELATVCAEFGIEVVQLRNMDFIDQANLFNAAEFIMAPHGAGLVNVLFCQAGVKVLEMMPTPNIVPHIYYSITAVVGGEYYYMCGRAVDGLQGHSAETHADFHIDAEKLKQVLQKILH
jgi:capsular polysaccharide biosynthesis protein